MVSKTVIEGSNPSTPANPNRNAWEPQVMNFGNSSDSVTIDLNPESIILLQSGGLQAYPEAGDGDPDEDNLDHEEEDEEDDDYDDEDDDEGDDLDDFDDDEDEDEDEEDV